MMILLYVETLVWTGACVAKPTIVRPATMMTFLYVKKQVWTDAFVAKLTFSASYSWWWLFYMSKRTCEQVFVLPSRRLVGPAADDEIAICQNARVDRCLYCQADV